MQRRTATAQQCVRRRSPSRPPDDWHDLAAAFAQLDEEVAQPLHHFGARILLHPAMVVRAAFLSIGVCQRSLARIGIPLAAVVEQRGGHGTKSVGSHVNDGVFVRPLSVVAPRLGARLKNRLCLIFDLGPTAFGSGWECEDLGGR